MRHWLLDTLMHSKLDSKGNQGVDAFEYDNLVDALQDQKLCYALYPNVRTIIVSTDNVHDIEPPNEEGMPPIIVHQRFTVKETMTLSEDW